MNALNMSYPVIHMPWCRESKHREILNRRAKVQIKAENLASFKVFLIKKPCFSIYKYLCIGK